MRGRVIGKSTSPGAAVGRCVRRLLFQATSSSGRALGRPPPRRPLEGGRPFRGNGPHYCLQKAHTGRRGPIAHRIIDILLAYTSENHARG